MASKPSLDLLLAGDRRTLAKSITLVESKRPSDHASAVELLEAALPYSGNSLRIGISGVPGVGKSTFIESFGLYLIEQGRKVAVLAVDPSSPVAGGSILGDKTRMPELSRADEAFIRPSPTSGMVGGLAHKTRESIILCEAAGYDIVLVETVGVGQVEVDVRGMVDFFMILMVPNAGDDLQGIKRGITELVDAIVVNKADGESVSLADKAMRFYQSALNILGSESSFWKPRVLTCSALERTHLDSIWNMIREYEGAAAEGDYLLELRRNQNLEWLRRLVDMEIQRRLSQRDETKNTYRVIEQQVLQGVLSPTKAADRVIEMLFETN